MAKKKPNGTGTEGTEGTGGAEGGAGPFGPVNIPPPQGYANFGYDFNANKSGTSSSGSSVSSDYDLRMDHTSGQDMAAQLSQALLEEAGNEMQLLMEDPMAAIASGDRIRNLSRMIQAYKGGYDLPDLEVIPHSRVAAESFGTRATSDNKNSSSGSSSFNKSGRNLQS